MTPSQLLFILLTVFSLAAGQLLFKLAAASFEFSVSGLLNSVYNVKLIIALVVYFVATIMWLLVLKVTPLRVAYPFVALAFVIVPIFAHFLLGESIGWNTFVGAGLIAAGVWVSVYQ
jgi:drug/metabolite transporter (DMT)-like permease